MGVRARRSQGRAAPAALAVLLLAQVALIILITNQVHAFRPVLAVQIPAFGISGLVICLLWRSRLSRRSMTVLLLGGCAALQLAAVLGPPSTSDDDYRYMWDARVQLSGVDPYRYTPDEPALRHLRSAITFPESQPCAFHPVANGCTRINRPSVPTIYPPVAQAAFDVIWLVSAGGHGGHLPFQLAAAAGVLGTTVLLIRLANIRGRPLWPVAVWSLSPIVAIEATNNAHIEWLAALLAVASLLTLRANRKVLTGVLIGAAVATKLYPGLLLVNAGRRPVRMVLAAVAVLVLSYLPHVLAVGPKVVGYLPDYLREERYSSGSRYLILEWFAGGWLSTFLAPAVLLIGLLWLWWRADERQPELTAVAAFGLYLLVSTPNYSWYAVVLIALIAASGRLEWLWLGFAPSLQYMAGDIGLDQRIATGLGYGVAMLIVAVVAASRALSGKTGRLLEEVSSPVRAPSGRGGRDEVGMPR